MRAATYSLVGRCVRLWSALTICVVVYVLKVSLSYTNLDPSKILQLWGSVETSSEPTCIPDCAALMMQHPCVHAVASPICW